MTVVVVSHFHWDREWYRTMQGFRARLVDATDQVLDLAAADDNFRFLLDGQTIVLEDYLVVRPDRRDELTALVTSGRLAIGPWYVQPDSLLPTGEAHVRNLLAGRRAAAGFGPVSNTAYVPDSFGHPSQFPQLFAGFGLEGFVYWRGNGSEVDDLGPRWRWNSPDGSSIAAFHLTEGYFAASRPPDDGSSSGDGMHPAVTGLAAIVERLRAAGEQPVILMNGFDHTRPDANLGALLAPLAEMVGDEVRRGSLDEAVALGPLGPPDQPDYTGELVGGRVANLLPGVWSTRTGLKIRNRHCETLLQSWTEPWAALGQLFGLTDESAAIHTAWESLLCNQAHDSICGCSIDAVHDRMEARYDDAEGLASETLQRTLERLAGRGADREVPAIDDLEITVFNPTPRPGTALVTVGLDAHPAFAVRLGVPEVHSLVTAAADDLGFTIDGIPVRVAQSGDRERVRWLPDQPIFDAEFVAHDVPAFGSRRYRLTPASTEPDEIDVVSNKAERSIATADTTVNVADDGTLDVEIGDRSWTGLFALEDTGDRGDSYDFDPVGDPIDLTPTTLTVTRSRHRSGIQRLIIRRIFSVPWALDTGRSSRASDLVDLTVDIEVVVAPGVAGLRAEVTIDNTACDHRLRLRFPTGGPVDEFDAATTFDTVRRPTTPPDTSRWVHPAPTTFCQQGHVQVNDLTVIAPGLPEAEVDPDGTLLLTAIRAVGWLARYDLTTRAMPAGPAMEAPGAQCLGTTSFSVALLADAEPAAVQATIAGMRGVVSGPTPLIDDAASLLRIDDAHVVLSALKPAESGDGMIVRVLNPTDHERIIDMALGFDVIDANSVRLDETPDDEAISLRRDDAGNTVISLPVGPHQLRSLRILSASAFDSAAESRNTPAR